MPTTSCKEPRKEFQDTKPSVVKWGCEGPLLIYLILPPAMKARVLVGARCARLRAGRPRLRGGTHGGGEGAHACGGRARTPPWGGRARLLEGAHTCGKGAHSCGGRACTSTGGTHPCGEGTHACEGGAHVIGKARTPMERAYTRV
jgi:hypothetical protein